MTPTPRSEARAHAGNRIEVRRLPGRAPRRGPILEVLGPRGHEHHRVRTSSTSRSSSDRSRQLVRS